MTTICAEAKELADAIDAAGGKLSPSLLQTWTRRLKTLDQARRMEVAADILVLAIRCTRMGQGPWEELTDLALAAKSHELAGGQRYERGNDAGTYDRLSGRVARPAEKPVVGGTRLFDLLVTR